MQPPGSSVAGEQKKCWHMLGKKFDWFQTGRPTGRTFANIMQHIAQHGVETNTTCMLCSKCWLNMLRSFARALTKSVGESVYLNSRGKTRRFEIENHF